MEFTHTLNIDVETKSGSDLTKVGMYKYMEDPEFAIVLLSYSFDDAPVDCIDVVNGELLPDEFIAWLFNPTVKKKAWNAAFEIHAIRTHYALTLIVAQWECTMIKAVMLGLPASLDSAGIALGIRSKKMFVGKKLIRLFCIPCKPTKKNGMRRWNTSETHPNEWFEFKDYNEVDVYGEMEIGKTLDHFRIPDTEALLYILDQNINAYGVRVDIPFVEKAIAFNIEYTDKLIAEATAITGLQNVGSVKQLKEWLALEIDESVTTLTKDSVHTLLKGKPSDTVRRVLEIRQQISMASIKKYDAMLKMVCNDGYIRGTLQFYGAGRTARWAGRGVQVQNLRKNSMKDLHHAREVVRDRDLDLFELNWGNPPDVLSQLVRTAFIPADDCTFLMSDFSAIEARVIAWYADETWRLEVFRTHGKIYEASGANMFKVPIEAVTKGSILRDKAKISELALGYQGSWKALEKMGGEKMGLDRAEMESLVSAWREANSSIVQWWYALEAAAIKALHTRETQVVGNIRMYTHKGTFFVRLPSGRSLAYVKPELYMATTKTGKQKVAFKYHGVNPMTRQFKSVPMYGGKWAENIVQATARDILAEKMLVLDKKGFNIRFHVHDEVVIQIPNDFDKLFGFDEVLEEVNAIMSEPLLWCADLPLAADSYYSPFYRKD